MSKKYDPVGKCIYCGDTASPLSDEHIIPYSLGGLFVLPGASCARHRNLTSLLEGRVARGMYGNYRDTQGIQTRHKTRKAERQNKKVAINAKTKFGMPCEVLIPIQELPKVHVSVHLPAPQVLSNQPLTRGSLGSYVKAQLDPDPRAMHRLRDRYNIRSPKFTAGIQVETFLRVIAKIAHAYAVAVYGVDGFSPTLLPIIEGESDHLLQYIGAEAPEQKQSPEQLSISEIAHNNITYVAVYISLHSFPRLPRYQVIAGIVLSNHNA